jgi:pSer/pThr/pTyr-binding forkhead associated (FHA) protein
LHFDKIPLVETLGRGGDPTDLTSTRPAGPQQQGYAQAVLAVAPDSGAIKSMAASEPATALEDGPESAKPRLVVLRGEKLNVQYAIYPGKNYLGRTDDKPVDIDLENQEPPDRIWTSRQHAVITLESGVLTIEDLNSLNGTFVNRTRVHPGQIRTLQANDIIQLGTVQLRVLLG